MFYLTAVLVGSRTYLCNLCNSISFPASDPELIQDIIQALLQLCLAQDDSKEIPFESGFNQCYIQFLAQVLRRWRALRLVQVRVQRLLRNDRPGNRHPEEFPEFKPESGDPLQRSAVVLQAIQHHRVLQRCQEHRSGRPAPGGHQQRRENDFSVTTKYQHKVLIQL